jgi:lipopolysaccharide export system protein LptC
MRELLVFVALLLVAAVTWYATNSASSIYLGEPDPIETDEPDLYGKNIELSQFNADGSLHYRLLATTIRQYKQQELTQLTSPNLHLANSEQQPWDIQSKRGAIRKQTNLQGVIEDMVSLIDDVHMVRNHPEHGLITMRSQALDIFPDRQYAETDQAVIVETNVGSTEAGGMRVDLESGQLQLSSGPELRVHTIVLPEQIKKS